MQADRVLSPWRPDWGLCWRLLIKFRPVVPRLGESVWKSMGKSLKMALHVLVMIRTESEVDFYRSVEKLVHIRAARNNRNK